jgi:aspartyl-tRNA(Asn)/glutamyl-tRNA(Gln) amidotransferase subunit B
VLTAGGEPRRAASLMEALREMGNERSVPMAELGARPARVAEIAGLVTAGKIAAGKETAKALIAAITEADRPAEQAAADLGLIQVSDTGAIDAAIDALIAENSKSLQDYRGGKQQARGSLIGAIMKKGKGFNAKLVGERLDAKLKP